MAKKITLIVFLLACCLLSAAVDGKLNNRMTLRQYSEKTCIPVRKLIEYLELPQGVDIDKTVAELNRTTSNMMEARDRFEKNQSSYHWGIVVVGMGTVFVSLILVALVIGQLRHLDKKKRKIEPQIPKYSTAGLDTSEEDDLVAAIVTSLYLYELEVEENNRLMLTWKRAPVSMWKASRLIPMNEVDPSRRS